MTGFELLLAALILFFACALQGAVGFGSSLIAAPLLVLINPTFVPGPLIVTSLVLNALVIWREDEKVHPAHLGWSMVGRVPGSALGAIALATLPASQLSIGFGALVLLAVVISVGGWSLAPTSPSIVGAGALSGFMGTATSIGGPPIALLYQHEHGPQFRATVANLLVYGGFISLFMVVIVGEFGWDETVASVAFLPAVIAGFFLSSQLTKHLDRGHTRKAVLVVSGLSAVAVIVKAIAG